VTAADPSQSARDASQSARLVGIDDVRAAARGLVGIAIRTPLVAFGSGRPRVLLKAESLQPVGAFKIRGAYHAMASLDPAERAHGVVTHSSGNHAQGVARAARLLGIHAVIVMPSDAPAIKRARVEADGAEIVTVGVASGDREAMAERLALERGLVPIPPYDDDRIIAGQGTVGLEIAEDVPDLAAVLVPIGGGGLASGVAVAVRALHPHARIVGVEPELAADAAESLREGRIVRWDAARTSRTIADGTRSQAIGRRPFAHLSQLLDDVITVSESEIAAAVRLVAEESRLVAEPSGALAPAAARFRAAEAGIAGLTGTVVAVVSGGNVDPERYRALLASPLPSET
jgi:threonine dehydratase